MMDQEEKEKKERYIRWQDYRIKQLTFSINLFLSFAIASLAYVVNIKLTISSDFNQNILFITIYWWSASAVLGTVASLSRLLDFRYTAKIIMGQGSCDKSCAKFFGYVTWGAFWGQVISYVIGGYFFLTNIALI